MGSSDEEPGPFRRLFMTDGKVSIGLILCFVLFAVADVMGFLLGGFLSGTSFWTSMTMGMLCWFVGALILVFGYYVEKWANGGQEF